MSDKLRTEVEGRTLVVAIDRPEVRNAIDRDVAEGIAAAMDRLDADPALAAAVLCGTGDCFSAGMDLKAFAKGRSAYVEGRGFGGLTQRPPAKPLVAAVEGFALAGGLELALACDLIVTASDARFGIPEAARGLVAGAGALLRLPHRVPFGTAMELALTAEPIGAGRAHDLGLVDRLVEPGTARREALALAARIGENAPLAVARSKQILRAGVGLTDEQFWEMQRPLANEVFTSKDAKEGAVAFGEKRAPRWTGT